MTNMTGSKLSIFSHPGKITGYWIATRSFPYRGPYWPGPIFFYMGLDFVSGYILHVCTVSCQNYLETFHVTYIFHITHMYIYKCTYVNYNVHRNI